MPYELVQDQAPIESQPSIGQEVLRHGARTGSRIAEQVAGFPGDILSLINEYISRPIVGRISGKETQPYEELGISQILPTSQQLRKGNVKQVGKILEPQNKVESVIDNIVSDATSIFTPGTAIKKGTGLAKKAANALTISVGANTAKELTKDLTADEKKGAYAHLGALTLLSFLDKPGAAKAISEGYAPLQEKVAKLAPVNATAMETNLNNLKAKMLKGTQAPSEKFIIDEVDAVLGKIQNGKISPEEAWAAKRSLNEKLSKVLFEIPGKSSQQRARKLATNITHELDDVLKLTSKQDPKFYKELKSWNSAYGTMVNSNFLTKWVENNIKYNPATAGLMHLFGGPVGSVTAGAVVPYQGMKLVYRMSKSSKLAKHYSLALAKAAAEDIVSFNRQLKILDKEFQKEEKKDRFILVD